MWPDMLTVAERTQTARAVEALCGVSWAAHLVCEAAPLLQSMDQSARARAKMGVLLEARVAYELHRAERSVEYEYAAGVDDSTIDFRVLGSPEWFIEIVSVRASLPRRQATCRLGVFEEVVLSTNASAPKQSEEWEMVLVQRKIGAKVLSASGRPTKFPEPSGALHVILTDVRGLLCSDPDDYREVAYGAAAFPCDEEWKIHFWNGAPIKGLFDSANSRRAANLVRERIHFLGFVGERDYTEGEIADRARYFANPSLFSSDAESRAALASYPLRPRRDRGN